MSRILPAYTKGLIPHADRQVYPGYGHGNDQENPAYRPALDASVSRVMNL